LTSALEEKGSSPVRQARFFDLHPTHNPHRWFLPVSNGVCAGHGENLFLFGGVALAAAVTALECTLSRSVVFAAAQYVSYAKPGSVLDLDVWTAAAGRHTTQARVTGHVHDQELLTVSAALGDRPGGELQQGSRPRTHRRRTPVG
jgi:acyl-CoA thioesterase-2